MEVRNNPEFWKKILFVISKSSFLKEAKWFTIDWVIGKEESIIGLMEGKYDNREDDEFPFVRAEGDG